MKSDPPSLASKLRAVAADMSRAEIGIEGPLKVSEGRYALSGTQMVQRALGGGEAWNRVHCVLSCEDVFAFRFGEGISAAPLSAHGGRPRRQLSRASSSRLVTRVTPAD